ncbi:MAG: acyl-CoA dehydrogenase family protein, partial [Actinomycetota bacterium]|nr:acyl-CoA dehydrogenase family protein [Actinomycetota bacterium]
YTVQRSTFGKPVADRQGIQWMLAECAQQLYITRLMVLHIAWKMEQKMDLRIENSMAKTYIANMLCHVIDTAIQVHGALGVTHDVPFAQWYAHARANRIIDGPDEVHRWTVGKSVIRAYQAEGTTARTAGGDLF